MGNISYSLTAVMFVLIALNLWWQPKQPSVRRALPIAILLVAGVYCFDAWISPINLPVEMKVGRPFNLLLTIALGFIIFAGVIRKIIREEADRVASLED